MKKAILNLILLLNLSLLPLFSVTNASFFDNEIAYLPTLTASSLDFELIDQVGNPITELFNEDWWTNDAPVEEKVVVKNLGSQTFSYYPAFVFKNGESQVCKGLRLTANRDSVDVYAGQLNELTVPSLAAQLTGTEDLWIFTLENTNDDTSIQGKTCEFELKFSTVGSGFSDTETLSNSIKLAHIPTLSASHNSSTRTLSFTAGNLSTFTHFKYNIDYTYIFEGSEVTDHFEDTITLTGEEDKTIEKLLGTCSNTCTYQDNPHDFMVKVEFHHSDGHSVTLIKEL